MHNSRCVSHSPLFFAAPIRTNQQRRAINDDYLVDENTAVTRLLTLRQADQQKDQHISKQAAELVTRIRANGGQKGLDAFLLEYDLSSKEGVILMCIAEALLRIPDNETADKLIHDNLLSGDWHKHIKHSDSLLVNASTWGLMLTGKVIDFDHENNDINRWIKRLVANSGEPIIRAAMRQAMGILGQQFVMEQTVEAAIKRSQETENKSFRYSFDMLGEAAMTQQDAEHFFKAYQLAINRLAQSNDEQGDLFAKPSISIKLSALHPRYELSQRNRVKAELRARLYELALLAKYYQLGLTIDAEESERLDLSLDLFESLFTDPALMGWQGLGLAVQAYQKRAYAVIEWLIHLGHTHQKRIPIRLVKGAYWDSEIKRAQELGLSGYPVFTRKQHTDLSYQVCARKLLASTAHIYPQFATHNAHTIAYILAHTNNQTEFEFQRLHGMGEVLYQTVIQHFSNRVINCRVYAPVGRHKELLPYLVRRLLENGANTSFIIRIHDKRIPIEKIVENPVLKTQEYHASPHPKVPLPRNIYGSSRLNAQGFNLFDEALLKQFSAYLHHCDRQQWSAYPLINGLKIETQAQPLISPFDHNKIVGNVYSADNALVEQALMYAGEAYPEWNKTAPQQRCLALRRCADLLEEHFQHCLVLLILEAGKTIHEAVAEVREAIDYCRYYAEQAEKLFVHPLRLNGPTGERNILYLLGRGTFACISPWNFPLAIFMGQITAALVCGNTVIAKPAGQTPLIAAFAVDLLHEAGIPNAVLQLLPGNGSIIGQQLIHDPRVKGVAFTGSTATAQLIHQVIAQRSGGIIPLIAETGGQNTMIVDSSALPEQVVTDVMNSAFNSAGQRCSALRVLFLQEEVADKIIEILKGAMTELQIGDPRHFATDIGPVIDQKAKEKLEAHIEKMLSQAKLIFTLKMPQSTHIGSYIPPTAFEITHISQLAEEVFGPILHIIRYHEDQLDSVINSINHTGYGLTLGIHSRIESTINQVIEKAHVGNIYVNRNMIGAVVGVQPFGGEGLSGTGPKAGGPHYLYRFCTERAISTNTAAVGGNAILLALDGD